MIEKFRYRFSLRALTDPPDHEEVEAGPFPENDAGPYADSLVLKKYLVTGREWVCAFSKIESPAREVYFDTLSAFSMWLIIGSIFLTALVAGLLSVSIRQSRRVNP